MDREHSPALSQSAVMVDRARARLRLGRRLVLPVIATVALCVVVVWHRDATHVEKACERLAPHIASLQLHLDANGTLPVFYVADTDGGAISAINSMHYVEPEVIRWAMRTDEPVIIGHGPPSGLIRANGYAVAIYEGHKLHVGWRFSRELGPILAEQERRAAVTQASP